MISRMRRISSSESWFTRFSAGIPACSQMMTALAGPIP